MDAEDLAARREDYSSHGFPEVEMSADPFEQFDRWYADWLAVDPYDAKEQAREYAENLKA